MYFLLTTFCVSAALGIHIPSVAQGRLVEKLLQASKTSQVIVQTFEDIARLTRHGQTGQSLFLLKKCVPGISAPMMK